MNTWAVLELMGHQRALGYVEEVTVAGAGFLQITTPAREGEEPRVRIVSPSSIYAINPTTEERIRTHLYPPARAELDAVTVDNYCDECGERDTDCRCDLCADCDQTLAECTCDG